MSFTYGRNNKDHKTDPYGANSSNIGIFIFNIDLYIMVYIVKILL